MVISPFPLLSRSVSLALVRRFRIAGGARAADSEVVLPSSNPSHLLLMLMIAPMIRLLIARALMTMMMEFMMLVLSSRSAVASAQPLKELPSAGRLILVGLLNTTGLPLPEIFLVPLVMMPLRITLPVRSVILTPSLMARAVMKMVVVAGLPALFTLSLIMIAMTVNIVVAVAHFVVTITTRRPLHAAAPFGAKTKPAVMDLIAREGERSMLMVMVFVISSRFAAAAPGPLGPPPFVIHHIHTTSVMNTKVIKFSVEWPGVKDPTTKLPFTWPR